MGPLSGQQHQLGPALDEAAVALLEHRVDARVEAAKQAALELPARVPDLLGRTLEVHDPQAAAARQPRAAVADLATGLVDDERLRAGLDLERREVGVADVGRVEQHQQDREGAADDGEHLHDGEDVAALGSLAGEARHGPRS